MMTTVQKWLLGLVGLGALYLVVVHPAGAYQAAQGAETLIGGSETSIITGGAK
jgi:hypothetical protein